VDLEEGFAAKRDDDNDDDLDAREEIRFEHAGRRYEFGEWCQFEFEKSVGGPDSDDTETVEVPFARDVWPESIYEHVDDDEHGVRFIYRSHSGEMRRGTISADAFGSQSTARTRAGELMNQGVQVATDRGKEFAYALGRWMEARGGEAPTVRVTDTPGWHEGGDIYVNGIKVFGADDWFAREEARAITRRSGRAGTYEVWCKKMDRLLTTPGLRCALGVSLAGPLVAPIHPHSFIVHMYGESSSGKSTGGEVGASVWGTMDQAFNSWYGTSTSKENLAEIANGACLVLDELGQFPHSDRKLAEVIYNLCSDQGKTRSTQSGDLQEQREWKITCLSTGEISMKDRVGHHRKGGQDVRMIDVPIEIGEMTESRDHSNEVKRAVGAIKGDPHAGVAGDMWALYLSREADFWDLRQQKGVEHDRLLEAFGDGTAETDRILQSVALVSVALQEAHKLDADHHPALCPFPPDEAREAVDWLAQRAITDRDARTPNERALALFVEKVETEPQHYPTGTALVKDETSRTVWGVRQNTGEVWISESTVKASGLPREAGVGVRAWLNWLVKAGYAEKIGRKRIGGMQPSWRAINMDAVAKWEDQ